MMPPQFNYSTVAVCGAQCCQLCAHQRDNQSYTEQATCRCPICTESVPKTAMQRCNTCSEQICVVCRLRVLEASRNTTGTVFRSLDNLLTFSQARCPFCRAQFPRDDLRQLHMHHELHKRSFSFALITDTIIPQPTRIYQRALVPVQRSRRMLRARTARSRHVRPVGVARGDDQYPYRTTTSSSNGSTVSNTHPALFITQLINEMPDATTSGGASNTSPTSLTATESESSTVTSPISSTSTPSIDAANHSANSQSLASHTEHSDQSTSTENQNNSQ